MSNLTQFFVGGSPKIWVGGTTYAVGAVVLSPAGDYQEYVRVVAGAGTTDPASDGTNWKPYGSPAVKSIQRGILSGADGATATISAVNVNKTKLRHLGEGGNAWGDANGHAWTLSLTNSTTITKNCAVGASCNLSWELTEYY